jgi:hypothetical protein
MSGDMERYVADRMSAEEAAAFETRCEGDPAFAAALEEKLRFREGLRQLEESGRLASLLDEPWWKRRTGLQAIAATVVLTMFAGWWFMTTQPRPMLLAQRDAGVPIVETRMLVQLRGGSQPAVVTLPLEGMLELKILPNGQSSGGQWQLQMSPGDTALVLPEDSLGQLTAYLDGTRRLEPGRYRLEVRPTQGNTVEYFTLEVKRSTP